MAAYDADGAETLNSKKKQREDEEEKEAIGLQ